MVRQASFSMASSELLSADRPTILWQDPANQRRKLCPASQVDSRPLGYHFHRRHSRPRASFCHFSSSTSPVEERASLPIGPKTRPVRLPCRLASLEGQLPS